ncbi:MAG: sigma-70 family RNA polymerase sigma factor [Proteobacteria bacterium]|nr:sigma-70 family RNA polymerase sigma factor [Pseudomonadota bacterium]
MIKNNTQGLVPDEDQALIDGIKRGETGLFETLVDKYSPRLYNFGLKICKSREDAEDLVQESFINIFRYVKDFRQEASLKNWMYRIAASVCWKMKRKTGSIKEKDLSLEELMPDHHASPEQVPPAWAHEPVAQLLNQELSGQIQNAISRLPTPYRLVLVLRDMEGFSTDETADILSITPANVKVRLHRARLFVRDDLKEYYEHRP